MIFGEFAKCQAEAEYPELWQGLVGAWSPCVSPSGGTVLRDLSGFGNHGVLTNMDQTNDWVISKGYPALDFDGINDVVSCSNVEVLSQVTLQMWLTPTTISSDRGICGRTSSNSWNNGYGLSGQTSSTVYFWVNAYNSANTVSATVTAGALTHIRCVYDLSRQEIWVNGILAQSKSVTAALTSGGTFTIGELGGWTTRYIGTIHEVALYRARAPSTYHLGPGGMFRPRRRRWNYATAQTAIPYWVFARKNARLIGGGVS